MATVNQKLVLIADDDAAILELMKNYLESEGYSVLTEKTGGGLLSAVRRVKPRVVLLDLGLPDADGFEILPKIKAQHPDLPVIIVTGRHEESEARKAFSLGAWDYVTKPLDFRYLLNLLLLVGSPSV